MIGLEDRLRMVDGVASIRVELGDDGVDAIKVEVIPEADEAGVLEEIRQILVAYGLRSRKPGWKLGSRRNPPTIVAHVSDRGSMQARNQQAASDLFDLGDGGLPPIGTRAESANGRYEVRLDVRPPVDVVGRSEDSPVRPAPGPTAHPESGQPPTVRVQQGGRGLVIVLTGDGRTVEATSDVSPIGAAEAMAKVVADFHGFLRPDRVAVVMHELDGERVVTLMLRRGSQSVVTAEVANPMLHDALYAATEAALRQLDTASPESD